MEIIIIIIEFESLGHWISPIHYSKGNTLITTNEGFMSNSLQNLLFTILNICILKSGTYSVHPGF